MSLADPFEAFALGGGRSRSRDGRNALLGALRQVLSACTQPVQQPKQTGALADLGWQAAYRSLWEETPDPAAEQHVTPAEVRELRFF